MFFQLRVAQPFLPPNQATHTGHSGLGHHTLPKTYLKNRPKYLKGKDRFPLPPFFGGLENVLGFRECYGLFWLHVDSPGDH